MSTNQIEYSCLKVVAFELDFKNSLACENLNDQPEKM
jgi:hypothetical protein